MSPLLFPSIYSNNQIINVFVIYMKIFPLFVWMKICIYLYARLVRDMVALDISFHITILIHLICVSLGMVEMG